MKLAQLNLRVRIMGLKSFSGCSIHSASAKWKIVVTQVQMYYTHIQLQGLFLQDKFPNSMCTTAPL